MVFNLYKDRDFGTYISDTIDFFKRFWKNYFLNFIKLNGALLIILCLVYFFIFKDTFGQIISHPGAKPDLLVNENLGIFITMLVVGFIIAVIFTVITTAYPIVYLRLVEKTDKEEFSSSEIFNEIKGNAGRIIVFGLASIISFMPVFIVYFLLSALLSVLLIGIPLLILGIGAAYTWIFQSLYVYLNERTTFFTAMKEGWNILFSKFWHIAGTSTAMIFITSTLAGVISMVPYFIGIAKMLSTGNGEQPDVMGAMPWMITFYVLNIVLNYTLQNFIYINQGLIYYSSLEEQEHYQAYSEIDAIGKNEE